ncbi:penicillin-binding protein 1C [Fodinibius halophilus]|uniref:peptidoglycan glycosyltransferase n=1 Tax=Fodinibius halophilus TaxID=1736908 RepID=A0A6M1TEN4_9BACT|nr:penicillin-binding protein 1C [Fodinibius halophilus]NGP87100.1 penicillin-binding protein 1C [Fodinibius halophilus]
MRDKGLYNNILNWSKDHPGRLALGMGMVLALLLFWNCLPQPLFEVPYATVLEARNGQLLGAKIAEDGQWRFPIKDEVPQKFEQALLEFEDDAFYYHPGVNPAAIGRAMIQNIEAGKVVSGASTITMQVIRLSRKNQPRTYWEKIKEMILALRLELSYSKEEILALYAAHAPFGGNVVGLEAASWRYFGRPPSQLSWAESATLAVMPNSPALIHPGRNREHLEVKRNRLLKRLMQKGTLDSLTFRLAKAEPLPGKPLDLPQRAPHLLSRLYSGGHRGERIRSTVDISLQKQTEKIVQRHHKLLRQNEIHNAAAVIADVRTGAVKAYIGNTKNPANHHQNKVDVVTAPRSTGSILKPFLYMLMQDEGMLLPDMLVADVPTQISNYTPKNFSKTYAGAVPASEALSRSLNVPAVRLLQDYGVPRLHHYLQQMGMQTLYYPPEHYGLSLILGGAEGTLWDITGMYASTARFMNRYDVRDPQTKQFKSRPLHYIEGKEPTPSNDSFSLNAGAVWSTFEAMLEVYRPDDEINWRQYLSSRKVAWKTGTSYGFRDGWAVGVTPEYVIGVWVGNADGEGRPGLIGNKTAGPILFDLFDMLDETSWFHEPLYAMKEVPVCRKSGHRAGPYCTPVDTVAVPTTGLKTEVCPYHRKVHLDTSQEYRVHSRCMPVSKMKSKEWFVLPPVQEWYYRRNNPSYAMLPPLLEQCEQDVDATVTMELIYPHDASQIYVPKEMDGSKGKTVFEVAHRGSRSTIYWHLDEQYLGKTEAPHQMALSPEPGQHRLTLVDEDGVTLRHNFEILSR